MVPLASLILPFLLSYFSVRPVHAIPYCRAAPLPPSQDPWYPAPEASSLPLGKMHRIYNILYRTSDSFDKPSWAVTTLLVPPEPRHNGTSLFPSYTLDTQFASAFSDIIPSLSRGWYINLPDFEGLHAAFSVSVEEAHATLDSIRAAIAAENGLRSDTRVALWGYSGGTLPAPEINLVGVPIGALLANVTNALVTIDGQSYAGLSILTTLGLATSYPEVQNYLNSTLKSSGPYNGTEFFSVKSPATFDAFARFANQSIGNYFTTGEGRLNAAALKPAIDRNWQMGKYFTPQVPLYIYKAIHDEMSQLLTVLVIFPDQLRKGTSHVFRSAS
ncbi:secretory lipase-domain-containing protein [Aspergillus foveolatus]|uniref:secretory lipase-domain-containing protein n=1 Tax=Aspergillus foveolatus TaxID=210207 RepID=UPI003CCD5FF3